MLTVAQKTGHCIIRRNTSPTEPLQTLDRMLTMPLCRLGTALVYVYASMICLLTLHISHRHVSIKCCDTCGLSQLPRIICRCLVRNCQDGEWSESETGDKRKSCLGGNASLLPMVKDKEDRGSVKDCLKMVR